MPGAGPLDPNVTRLPAASSGDNAETYAGRPPSRLTKSGSRSGSRSGTRSGKTHGGFGEAATDLVGQDLGERYHIIKLLGAGGMGAVYQAWDGELGVAVALKTVRPEVAADPETARMLEQRFKQELLLARKVTHKNIVRVHDIGEVDGVKYITMPFVEGEDLATILKRDGKLSAERVMTIARSVASGLGAAHLAGVVHRDLKPANIMVDEEGEGLVMDFGVARSTAGPPAGGAAGTFPAGAMRAASAAQTMAGSVVGTVEYMAPEQARAEPVDQRADIYAFGLILYDLLLGRIRAAEDQQRHRRAPGAHAGVAAAAADAGPDHPGGARQTDHALHPGRSRQALRHDPGSAGGAGQARRQGRAAAAGPATHLEDDDRRGRSSWRRCWASRWWAAQGPPPPVQHEPVSILIADLTEHDRRPDVRTARSSRC